MSQSVSSLAISHNRHGGSLAVEVGVTVVARLVRNATEVPQIGTAISAHDVSACAAVRPADVSAYAQIDVNQTRGRGVVNVCVCVCVCPQTNKQTTNKPPLNDPPNAPFPPSQPTPPTRTVAQ